MNTLPRTTQERVNAAKTAGYLITSSNALGASRWLDHCRLCRWPFIVVIKDRRHWRIMIEMEGWRLTEQGQFCLTHLAAEHDARFILAGDDYFRATQTSQEIAELIATRMVSWVRDLMAEMAEQQVDE